jgi:predicted solute-binding protein
VAIKREMISPLTLGWIPYWNLRPLRCELQRAFGDSIKTVKGHPAEINRLMEGGEIQLAPSSSINLMLNPNLEIAMPAGVVTNGEVQSVYLVLSREFASNMPRLNERFAELRSLMRSRPELVSDDFRMCSKSFWQLSDRLKPLLDYAPTIELSSASASGAMLSRIFYRMCFGFDHYNARAADSGLSSHTGGSPDIRLVIGDVALIERPNYSHVIDLGSWWKFLTDLPFVFAIWQKSKSLTTSIPKARMLECLGLAQAKMQVDPSSYYPSPMPEDANGKPINLASYWKHIYYRFGQPEVRGMLLFFALSRSFLSRELADASAIRILRWHEQIHLEVIS